MSKQSPKQADIDNRSRQLNPDHPAYWSSRDGEKSESPPPQSPPEPPKEQGK